MERAVFGKETGGDMGFRLWAMGGILLAACALGGCDRNNKKSAFPGQPTNGASTRAMAAEPWIELPPEKWPQFVLTNRAAFTDHTGLNGASGFLVRTSDGRVLAATAKHLIGANGGVEPDVPMAALDASLKSWVMFPRTDTGSVVELDRLQLDTENEDSHDWLLMSIKPSAKLPALPLTMRMEPVQVGETVYLIGVPYSEPKSAQNVYRGVVTKRAFKDRFRYTLSVPVELRGFSGAPIVDADGRVVGMMTIWFKGEHVDGKDVDGGGEDAATALGILRRG